MHTVYNPDFEDHTTRRTTPAPGSHQSTPRHMCRLYIAGFPPHCLVELQFRDRISIDTRIVQQPIMPGFWSSQLLPNLHIQQRGARRSDCRCTCWLSYMFQYLPRRRRLCDEPNEAHPPAALEWKHPVDACQQLCPQISRRVSCPRGAKICAHCLWPGCFAPRPQLPAGLHHHLRAPRRVRRQHPKVAVPMLGIGGINAAARFRNLLTLRHIQTPTASTAKSTPAPFVCIFTVVTKSSRLT